MTVAELQYGVLKSRDPTATGTEVEQFLALLEILPFDETAAEVHARARLALEAAGQPIGERDLVIAATALALFVIGNCIVGAKRNAGFAPRAKLGFNE